MTSFFNKRPYKEHKVKSLQEIMDYLDDAPSIAKQKAPFDDLANLKVLTFNGSEIDALKIIKK